MLCLTCTTITSVDLAYYGVSRALWIVVQILFHCFSEKIRLGVSSESSAMQRIHIKNQALFSSKDKSKTLKYHLLQFFVWCFKS